MVHVFNHISYLLLKTTFSKLGQSGYIYYTSF